MTGEQICKAIEDAGKAAGLTSPDYSYVSKSGAIVRFKEGGVHVGMQDWERDSLTADEQDKLINERIRLRVAELKAGK